MYSLKSIQKVNILKFQKIKMVEGAGKVIKRKTIIAESRMDSIWRIPEENDTFFKILIHHTSFLKGYPMFFYAEEAFMGILSILSTWMNSVVKN